MIIPDKHNASALPISIKVVIADMDKNQEAFLNFQLGIKNKHTRRNYYLSVDRFMTFSKMDYEQAVKLTPKQISSKIKQYVIFMLNQDLATNTLKNNLSAIFLFFDMNDILLNKRKLYRAILPDEKTQKKKSILAGALPYTTEEIKRLLGATNKLRTKALIHFYASTGARPAVLWDPFLRMKYLSDMPEGCKAVHLYADSDEEYYSFLTPEAAKALEDYHNERKLNGEVFTDETPLFTVRGGSPMSEDSVRAAIKTTIKLAGIEKHKVNNKTDKPQFYGFRKRFNTIMKRNGSVNSNIVEKMIGHKNGLDGVYLKPTKEECFVEFYKAVSDLMVDQSEVQKHTIIELQHTKDHEISNLKDEISTLREIVNELKIPKEEWDEIIKHSEELKVN